MKRNAAGDIIDKLIGEEGLKTDVSVKLTPSTIPILLLVIVVGVTGSILLANLIQKTLKK
jgi:hypothetical protein